MTESALNRQSIQQEAGATLVEFGLSIIVLLGTIGFILQIGVIFYHYSVLRYTAFRVVRELTANVGHTRCASTLVSTATNRAQEIMRDGMGLNSTDIIPTIGIVPGPTKCALSVVITDEVQCFFCFLLVDKISLRVQQAQYIGDECFNCNC